MRRLPRGSGVPSAGSRWQFLQRASDNSRRPPPREPIIEGPLRAAIMPPPSTTMLLPVSTSETGPRKYAIFLEAFRFPTEGRVYTKTTTKHYYTPAHTQLYTHPELYTPDDKMVTCIKEAAYTPTKPGPPNTGVLAERRAHGVRVAAPARVQETTGLVGSTSRDSYGLSRRLNLRVRAVPPARPVRPLRPGWTLSTMKMRRRHVPRGQPLALPDTCIYGRCKAGWVSIFCSP